MKRLSNEVEVDVKVVVDDGLVVEHVVAVLVEDHKVFAEDHDVVAELLLLLRPREGWSMAKDATLSRRVVMTTRSCLSG